MLEPLARLVEAPTTLGNEEPGQALMAEAFREIVGLEPVDIPWFLVDIESGTGTLYTAVYKPARGAVEYRWPSFAWEHSFERFREGGRTVRLIESAA